jgi:hypothetical protein
MSDGSIDKAMLEEAMSRISHNNAQVQKLLAETLKLRLDGVMFEQETAKLRRESAKFEHEGEKLRREAAKVERDRSIAPWQIVVSAMAAGAASFGAGVAFWKVFGT